MKKVRTAVFETNSSSTHSISINGDVETYDTIPLTDNKYVVLTGGEFGWEWEKYNDALTKANYVAVDVFESPEKLEMLRKVILEHTGAKDVVVDINKDYGGWCSYIDHDSVGTSADAFDSEKALKDFIFSPKSWLYLGNDNESPPPNYYDDPDAEYRYELVVDGISPTWKSTKILEGEELFTALKNIVDKHPELHNYNYGREQANLNQFTWDVKGYDSSGKKHIYNSYTNINKGIVTLFYTKSEYDPYRMIVVDELKLKFRFKKL